MDIRGVIFIALFATRAVTLKSPVAPAIPDLQTGGLVIEEHVNVFTRSDQDHGARDVAPDSRAVLVWDSRRQEAGTSGVYARLLDPPGRPLTHEVHVNQYIRSHQCFPDVAWAGGDIVWFVRDSHGQDGQAGSIVARRFSPDLTPAGPEIAVNTTREGNQTSPVVVGGTDGSAIIAWANTVGGGQNRSDIRAILLNSDGGTASDEFVISGVADGRDVSPSIASLPGRGDRDYRLDPGHKGFVHDELGRDYDQLSMVSVKPLEAGMPRALSVSGHIRLFLCGR